MRHSLCSWVLLGSSVLLLAGCRSEAEKKAAAELGGLPAHEYPQMGKVERFDPALDALIPAEARIQKLAQGFDWSEGPVWVSEWDCLLFSDVPANTVFRWEEVAGLSTFLKPSGYTAPQPRSGEPGSNGLTLDRYGRLILCQHGDRRISRLVAPGKFEGVAVYYQMLRFNSPNDCVYSSDGDLYFTDPPYGLEGLNESPKKELMFNGVFRLSGGEVTLITSELTFPNGIALSPDENTLYVAVSDPARPVIMAYPLARGVVGKGRVFFDAGPLAAEGRKGLPDGLKVDQYGNLFATGPGGVLVVSPEGKLLGILNTGEATANCAWGNDGSVLYITADTYLCRIQTSTRGSLPGPALVP